ncbi:MAG: hypothetical protein QOH91_2151 [Mycobacterium sp.]|nr:hypothetical protein [Mycobacterium sp.]
MSTVWLTVEFCAACSTTRTASPPAETPATSTSTSAAARPVAPPSPSTSPLAKDWKNYGGTVYFGCPEAFSSSKSVLEDIRPKIFDTKTGQFTSPAIPPLPVGANVTGGMCALSGAGDDMKVVYVLTTAAPANPPAPDVTQTTAYLFDLKSNQPLATKELQPPAPELKLAATKEWRLGATAVGVAWINAFSDEHGAASPPRTVILSNTDLSMGWNDPQPGRVWQDILAFQRNTTPGKTSGAELRLPIGEPVFQNNDIETVEAELSDGPDKLVKMARRDPANPSAMSTMIYDLNSRSVIKFGDSDSISGSGLVATLSDGRLFIDGRSSANSQFGFGVWNLRAQQWDLLKTREEASKSLISKLASFGDRVYITYVGGTLSVIGLPAANSVASNWSVRPFARISGWTLVCRGETPASGECKEIVMVQDEDGHYPGPWT